MIATITSVIRGYNWYDALVPVVLVYGAWSGWESPFHEKIFGVIEMALALVAGITCYIPLSLRMESILDISSANSHPAAFILIAVLVRLLSRLVQHLLRRPLRTIQFQPTVDKIGSTLAGVFWAAGLMIWITVAVCLTNAPFLHDQIGRSSKFGTAVIARVPAAAITVTKHMPAPSAEIPASIQEDLHADDVDM